MTLSDLRNKVKSKDVDKKVKDIATQSLEVAYPDETLYTALKRFASKQIGRLPVVDRETKTRLLGLITRSGIVNTYNKKVVEKSGTHIENTYENSKPKKGPLTKRIRSGKETPFIDCGGPLCLSP